MRRNTALLAIGLFLAAGLAGCLGGDAGPAEHAADAPAPGTLDLLAARPMPQEYDGSEPNIAILGDGTIFVTANAGASLKPTPVEGNAWLWRSSDGGATWDVLRSPEVAPGLDRGDYRPWGSGDADVVTSPDGWVYYTDFWVLQVGVPQVGTTGLVRNIAVEGSGDGGDSWPTRSPVSAVDVEPGRFGTQQDNVNGMALDRQWLAAGDDGRVGLFFSDQQPDRHLDVAWSIDHGQTWSLPSVVVPSAEGEHYRIGHPWRTPDGGFVLPYGVTYVEESKFTDPAEVRVAVSTDEGATWDQVRVADVPHGFGSGFGVAGAVDDTGNVAVAWIGRRNITDDGDDANATWSVFFAESQDRAASWSEPVAIRSQGLNFLPWVAATGDGRVAVGWYGGDATGDPMAAGDEAEWFAYVAERPAPSAGWVVGKVDPRAVKVGPMCPYGGSCASDRELLDYLSLEYAPDDRLHIVFARSPDVTGEDFGARVFHAAAAVPPSGADLNRVGAR